MPNVRRATIHSNGSATIASAVPPTAASASRWLAVRLVGCPILPGETPGAIGERLEVRVDVGIADLVIRGAITDDQEDSIGRRVVDEAMAVASASGETGAHSGGENLLSSIRLKRDLAFEHVDDFILS